MEKINEIDFQIWRLNNKENQLFLALERSQKNAELSLIALHQYQLHDSGILNEITATINWLEKYKKLFIAVILKPKGIPLIIRPYCDDHQAIIDFFKLYEKLREGIITDKEIDSLNGY